MGMNYNTKNGGDDYICYGMIPFGFEVFIDFWAGAFP